MKELDDLTPTEIKQWAASRLNRAERRVLRDKYKGKITENNPNLEKKELNKLFRSFFSQLDAQVGESTGQRMEFGQSGATFYDLMNRLEVTDRKRRPLTKYKFEEGVGVGLSGRISVAKPDLSVFSEKRNVMFSRNAVQNSYSGYLQSLEPDKRENVIATVKKIKNKMKEGEAVTRAKKRSKFMKINKSKFIGYTDFSKASTREETYALWEETSKKYAKVKSTLDKLLEEAEKTDIYALMLGGVEEEKAKLQSVTEQDIKDGLQEGRRTQAQRLVLEDVKNSIEDKEKAYQEGLKNIKNKVEKMNLEYLVKVDVLKVPFKVSSWERMLDALARYENAESILRFQDKKQAPKLTEEVSLEETFSNLEEASYGDKMVDALTEGAPSSDNDYTGATADDASLRGDTDTLMDEEEERLQRIATEGLDPLLAIEVASSKKLISMDEESKKVMQDLVRELRQGTDLEFISQADKWLDELEDSYLIEQDNYILPASTFQSTKASSLKLSTLPTAIESKNYDLKGDLTEQNLNELFDSLHKLFVSERYSFLRYTRTDTENRTSTDYADAKRMMPKASIARQKILRLFTEGRRRAPTIPAKRGRLISGISDSDVGKALGEFIIACNEYYFEPFLKGRTPFAYPRFMSGSGGKALTALADDLSIETMSGNVARRLSGVANVQLTAGQMASLTKFLTLMDEITVVEDKTIKAAEKAAKVLTKIFGRKKDNLDTVSAILYGLIERNDKNTSAATKVIEGETIGKRAKSFNNSKNPQSYPIFALFLFLETNQGLLTRNKPMRDQYDKLMKVMAEVEDEVPEILMKLLEAHTEIRKSLGKKVVKGRFPFNYDGFDKIAETLYVQENIDLSILEVENIVKAVDSHANIGREYGITEDQVYLIKAHVR